MYERGKFGIEYNPRSSGGSFGRPAGDAPRRWWPWLLGVVALATLVSFCHTLIKRMPAGGDRPVAAAPARLRSATSPSVRGAPGGGANAVEKRSAGNREAAAVADGRTASANASRVVVDTRRPARVSTLLMRLDEAKRRRNDALAASTIELLLALPGNPVADLEDKLRRELGDLNLSALFVRKSAMWVAAVTVKRGDAAERIAREYGSTYASLVKLNGATSLGKLRPGQVLKVMNHPRFNLVVHRRMRIADLELDGKFFRRYDLQGDVAAKPGVYEVPERLRPFLGAQGILLRPADRAELELLVPKGASVLVSEL